MREVGGKVSFGVFHAHHAVVHRFHDFGIGMQRHKIWLVCRRWRTQGAAFGFYEVIYRVGKPPFAVDRHNGGNAGLRTHALIILTKARRHMHDAGAGAFFDEVPFEDFKRIRRIGEIGE